MRRLAVVWLLFFAALMLFAVCAGPDSEWWRAAPLSEAWLPASFILMDAGVFAMIAVCCARLRRPR